LGREARKKKVQKRSGLQGPGENYRFEGTGKELQCGVNARKTIFRKGGRVSGTAGGHDEKAAPDLLLGKKNRLGLNRKVYLKWTEGGSGALGGLKTC